MKILVCGGRNYRDAHYLHTYLGVFHELNGISLLIAGGASGADRMAVDWARNHGVKIMEFPADWSRYGKAAGPIRNALMLEDGRPDEVITFPGGRGTENMIKLAKFAGVKVTRAQPNEVTA